MRNVDANAQWGGRFARGPSVIMQDINASIGFDRKMWRQDIKGSLAHAAMLARAGVIAAADETAIRDGLGQIAAEIEAGRFPFIEDLEDIHMNIEARLVERVGEPGWSNGSARRERGSTRGAAATTRSRPTSGFGCATASTGSMRRSPT
jgi:argininosuccinate lyase